MWKKLNPNALQNKKLRLPTTQNIFTSRDHQTERSHWPILYATSATTTKRPHFQIFHTATPP